MTKQAEFNLKYRFAIWEFQPEAEDWTRLLVNIETKRKTDIEELFSFHRRFKVPGRGRYLIEFTAWGENEKLLSIDQILANSYQLAE